jgi:hypothetical protein
VEGFFFAIATPDWEASTTSAMSTNIVFIAAIAAKQNPDSAIQGDNSVAIADCEVSVPSINLVCENPLAK